MFLSKLIELVFVQPIIFVVLKKLKSNEFYLRANIVEENVFFTGQFESNFSRIIKIVHDKYFAVDLLIGLESVILFTTL